MEDTLRPAGFWIRFVALVIDGLILGIPMWCLFFMVGYMHSVMLQFVSVAVYGAYYVYFWTHAWQATPGKRLLNLYVLDATTGGRLSLQQAGVRYVLLNLAALLMLGASIIQGGDMPGLNPEEQQRITEIQERMASGKTISEDEQQYVKEAFVEMQGPMTSVVMLISTLGFVWSMLLAFSVGLTKEKTGLHDIIGKTRVVHGRPGE